MNKRLAFSALPLIALSLYSLGCDSAPNPIAPSGTTLSITANPARISLNGSSMITVSGFRPDGNPLNPDTQLTVSTSLGVLRTTNNINGANANIVRANSNGVATFYLFGDGRQGVASVSAALTLGGGTGGGGGGGGAGGTPTTGGATSVSLDIQIGEDATTQPVAVLTANPADIVLGGTSEITIRATNPDQSPLVGGAVTLRTSLGSLNFSEPLVTDSQGVATATLSSTQSGTATITGTAGSSAEATVDVTIGTTRMPVVTLSANPSSVEVGEISTITVTARDENGNLLAGSSTAIMTADRGALSGSGFNSSTDELTLSNGRGSVAYTATGPAGDGEVTAFVQNSDIASVPIVVRGIPADIGLSFTGMIPSTGPGTITLTATVVDADSIRLEDQAVTFSAFCNEQGMGREIGGNFNPNPAFTNTNGVATSTIVLNTDNLDLAADCGGDPAFVQIVIEAATTNGFTSTVEIEIGGT